MELKPETDREIYISLNNEVKALRETIERFGVQLLHLEGNKFSALEARVDLLDKAETERKGMWKLIMGIRILIAIAASAIALKVYFVR